MCSNITLLGFLQLKIFKTNMGHKRTMDHMSCHHSAREVLDLPYCTNIPEPSIIEGERLLPCNRAVIYMYSLVQEMLMCIVYVRVCVWGGGGEGGRGGGGVKITALVI